MIKVPFSELPGRHERHYRRRLANPLFTGGPSRVDENELLEVQRLDHEELLGFLAELRATVQRAVDLDPNVGSEVILELKESLDRLYETSAGLAEDHAGNQAAIRQLTEVIMRNVERGAAGDPQALDELARERIAREEHFALLRSPLVADLLHPHGTIGAEELAPSLLSAGEQDLTAALQLFDLAQLIELYADARRLMEGRADQVPQGGARLAQMAVRLDELRGQTVIS